MKVLFSAIAVFCMCHGLYAQATLFGNYQTIPKPKAPKQQHFMEQHGDVRDDEYYWLKQGTVMRY